MKVCLGCKIPLDESEFYTRSGRPDLVLSYCKNCMKKRSKDQVRLPAGVSSVPTETAVMIALAAEGVPSCPGRDLSRKYVDVVAWGCVNLEIKSSIPDERGYFTFALTERQKQNGVRGDLIVLTCVYPALYSFHVFPTNHAIFFNDDERKQYIVYASEPLTHRKTTHNGKLIVHLTPELMQQHQDAWGLIENVRLAKSEALRNPS